MPPLQECFALVACPYLLVLSTLLALASFASDARGTRADYARLVARARAACSSVSSDEIRMNPSAASCGNVSPVP